MIDNMQAKKINLFEEELGVVNITNFKSNSIFF